MCFYVQPHKWNESPSYTHQFGEWPQGAICISANKDIFVFNSDKWNGVQSLFIVTQTLGLISNAFQAWKTFWWNGVCMSVWENVQYLSFFYLMYLIKHYSFQVHYPCCYKWQFFIFFNVCVKPQWDIISHLLEKTRNNKCWWNVKKREPFVHMDGDVN